MVTTRQRQDFLEWAKVKGPEDVLAHSSVAEPTIYEMVNNAYCSTKFRELLKEDNQWGLGSLKKAIAQRYGIEDSEDRPRVLLTPGASNAIYIVCETFLNPGDEVIIELPCYQPLLCAAEKTGARVILWRRQDGQFSLERETLVRLVTPKTKLIMLSNPHNPSNALTAVSEFLQIARIVQDRAPSNGIKIVVDEIYLDIAKDIPNSVGGPMFAKGKVRSVAQMGDKFISINSLSKVYGLGRIRCGWILGSPEVIERLRETYKVVVNIGSHDTEAVASAVFDNLDKYTERSKRIVEANRKVMEDELGDLIDEGILEGEIPEYGCIYFPKLPWLDHLENGKSELIIDALDSECGVVPGRFFGGDEGNDKANCYNHYIRIGFGGTEDKFHSAITNLKGKLERLYRDNAKR